MYCCQAVLPHMLAEQWGRIVILTSHARFGSPERVAYGVSKAGVTAIAGAIGAEYASRGILANCVDPGRVLTDMIVPRFDAEYLASPPGVAIGRLARPEEIAEVNRLPVLGEQLLCGRRRLGSDGRPAGRLSTSRDRSVRCASPATRASWSFSCRRSSCLGRAARPAARVSCNRSATVLRSRYGPAGSG